jgi:hypothetical protein
MSNISSGEKAEQKTISFKPAYAAKQVKTLFPSVLHLNLSQGISVMSIYFMKNTQNKKFIKELQKIWNTEVKTASRTDDDDQAVPKSISFKPSKIKEKVESLLFDVLNLNISQGISVLTVYFIKHKNDKKFIKELKEIWEDINSKNITLSPSF